MLIKVTRGINNGSLLEMLGCQELEEIQHCYDQSTMRLDNILWNKDNHDH